MAITKQMARLILAEHLFRPLKGNILLLGRQTVFMTPEQAKQLVMIMGISIRSNVLIEYDNTTMGRRQNFISDKSFFALFTDATVLACDVSDYEGADFIFDLSEDLPAHVIDRFDFIYNGSVLDNVFDPAACIKNISRMLKSNGVVFHYEGLKHIGLTYLKFTPEWFFDYYAINNFNDCQIYLLAYQDYFGKYFVLEWNAYIQQNTSWEVSPVMPFFGEAMVVLIAEKSSTTLGDKTPIQSTYRRQDEKYLYAHHHYTGSKRRQDIHNRLLPQSKNSMDVKLTIFTKIKILICLIKKNIKYYMPEWIKIVLRYRYVSIKRKIKNKMLPYQERLGHQKIGVID